MICLYCGKELTGKKQYCDDAHRMAYRRRTKAGAEPEQNDPEHTTRTFDFELTRTDRKFEDAKPNYYSFDDEVFPRKCMHPDCEEAFKTRLKLLKFCSPEHMNETLSGRWIELARAK